MKKKRTEFFSREFGDQGYLAKTNTEQKIKFSIKDFISKCDQIRGM